MVLGTWKGDKGSRTRGSEGGRISLTLLYDAALLTLPESRLESAERTEPGIGAPRGPDSNTEVRSGWSIGARSKATASEHS